MKALAAGRKNSSQVFMEKQDVDQKTKGLYGGRGLLPRVY
jgi:hypothetical protein